MNFFNDMKDSVINFRAYETMKKYRLGKLFGYLALLFLIIYTMTGVRLWLVADQSIATLSNHLTTTLPAFEISNGQLHWSGDPLYYVLNEDKYIIAVDMNETLSKEALANKGSGYMILTKTACYLNNPNQTENVIKYADVGLNFTKTELTTWLEKLSSVVIVMLTLFFPVYYGYKLLNVLFLAVLASIAANLLKSKLTWKENFVISGYALTLPALLQLLFVLAGLKFPAVVYWLISIVYVIMVINQNKQLSEMSSLEARLNEGEVQNYSNDMPFIELDENGQKKIASESTLEESSKSEVEQEKEKDI